MASVKVEDDGGVATRVPRGYRNKTPEQIEEEARAGHAHAQELMGERGDAPVANVKAEGAAPAGIVTPQPVVDKDGWVYQWADGRFSHRHVVGKKLPPDRWPIWDHGIPPTPHLVITDSESHADAIRRVTDTHLDRPISAITWDGEPVAKVAPTLIVSIMGLQPATILLFPANTASSRTTMRKVGLALAADGFDYVTIDPKAAGCGPLEGAMEYLATGGSMASLVQRSLEEAPGERVNVFVSEVAVTQTRRAIYPTREFWSITKDDVDSMWLSRFKELASPAELRQAKGRLLEKAAKDPTAVYHRRIAGRDGFFWRPRSQGLGYVVDAQGVDETDDPDRCFVMVPTAEAYYSSDVDLNGDKRDFQDFLDRYRLDALDRAMVEGWLVSCLCGVQTPILYMRGESGSGKTTLARFLVGVTDPVATSVNISKDGDQDHRHLVRLLESTLAVLLDNISSMKSNMEDTLSKLVTGSPDSLRTMYGDGVEYFNLRKGLIVTTVGWDVYKSDLMSRIVVATPHVYEGAKSNLPDDEMMEYLNAVMPKIRGYIFKRCAEYYEKRDRFRGQTQRFRIGTFGKVLQALGYAADELALQERKRKAGIVSQNDPLMDAFIQVVHDTPQQSWSTSATDLMRQLNARLTTMNVIEAEQVLNPRQLARYVDTKADGFMDWDFKVTRYRKAQARMYGFEKLGEQTELPDDVFVED